MDNRQILIRYLQQKGCSKNSIRTYVQCCDRYTAWAESKQIEVENTDYSDLMDYIAELRKRDLTQRSIAGYVVALRHYFESLVAAKILTQNPAKYLELKSPPARKLYPVLNREQLENLYTQFEGEALRATAPSARASAIRNKITTGLMVFQGLDCTALGQLTVKDIDLLGGKINIRSCRSHAARSLALQAIQIIELDRYINQTRKELQHWFKQENSDQLLIIGFGKFTDALKHVMRRLRKQEPQLQGGRHIRTSVITHWLKQYNLREVQYMAGHKRVFSTERYQQNDTEGLQLDVDQFHPLG